MAAQNKKYIELRQHQDFGQVISTSFDFLFANFGNFFKTVFAISGSSFVLSMGLLSFWFYKFINNLIGTIKAPSGFDEGSDVMAYLIRGMNLWYLLGGTLILLFSLLFTYLTVYSYMKIYVSRGKLQEITTKEVWEEVKYKLWKYIGASILFFVVMLVVNAMVIFSASVSGVAYFFLLLGSYALIYYLYLYFPVIINEDEVNVMDAFGRTFYLVKGRWWFTFGISFILLMLCYVLTLLVTVMGAFVVGAGRTLLGSGTSNFIISIAVISGSVLAIIYSYMIFCFFIIKNSVMYYSYVELKDSVGLLEKIQSLGGGNHNETEAAIHVERNNQQYTQEKTDEEF